MGPFSGEGGTRTHTPPFDGERFSKPLQYHYAYFSICGRGRIRTPMPVSRRQFSKLLQYPYVTLPWRRLQDSNLWDPVTGPPVFETGAINQLYQTSITIELPKGVEPLFSSITSLLFRRQGGYGSLYKKRPSNLFEGLKVFFGNTYQLSNLRPLRELDDIVIMFFIFIIY